MLSLLLLQKLLLDMRWELVQTRLLMTELTRKAGIEHRRMTLCLLLLKKTLLQGLRRVLRLR